MVRHPSGKIREPELHRYDAHEARQVAKQGVCAPQHLAQRMAFSDRRAQSLVEQIMKKALAVAAVLRVSSVYAEETHKVG